LMAYLHRRGVRGYLTFNTLVFQNELEEAREVLRTAIAAGAGMDARVRAEWMSDEARTRIAAFMAALAG